MVLPVWLEKDAKRSKMMVGEKNMI